MGIVVHRDNRPLYANQAFADMIGMESPGDVLAMTSMDDYATPSESERLASYRRLRLRGEPVPECYEFQAVRSDRRAIWLETHVTIFD